MAENALDIVAGDTPIIELETNLDLTGYTVTFQIQAPAGLVAIEADITDAEEGLAEVQIPDDLEAGLHPARIKFDDGNGLVETATGFYLSVAAEWE
jgi:hypothetical protein